MLPAMFVLFSILLSFISIKSSFSVRKSNFLRILYILSSSIAELVGYDEEFGYEEDRGYEGVEGYGDEEEYGEDCACEAGASSAEDVFAIAPRKFMSSAVAGGAGDDEVYGERYEFSVGAGTLT